MAKTRRSRGSRKSHRKGSRKAHGTRKHRGGASGQRKASSRKASDWAQAVKRVHQELKRKNANASLGDAMKEASRRKKNGSL